MKEGCQDRQIQQNQSTLQRLFLKRRGFQCLQLALMGFFMVIGLHAGIAVAASQANDWKVEYAERSPTYLSQSLQPSATSPPDPLVQQAEDRYQAGQLVEAIALWQQAVIRYEKESDRLNQALVLSFMTTAFADLGQWTQAQEAIEQALSLLNAQNSTADSEIVSVLAQVLTTQGQLQLAQDRPTEALETWQAAEAAYHQVDDTIGILGSQINQARALEAEGLYRRATTLLTQVEQSLQSQPNDRLKVTGLRNLGKILRLVGNLAQSRAVLEQGLAIAEQLRDETQKASDLSGILLSLGNTTRAQEEPDTALTFYSGFQLS